MAAKLGYIEELEPRGDRRAHERKAVHFEASAVAGAGVKSVVLLDLSESGMRVLTDCELGVGERIRLHLPRAPEIVGDVRWRQGKEYGVLFRQRISPSVVSATILVSPPQGKDNNSRQERERAGENGLDRLTDRDLFWLVPLFFLVRVWFAAVDVAMWTFDMSVRIKANLRG